jgi:hypothetical protein
LFDAVALCPAVAEGVPLGTMPGASVAGAGFAGGQRGGGFDRAGSGPHQQLLPGAPQNARPTQTRRQSQPERGGQSVGGRQRGGGRGTVQRQSRTAAVAAPNASTAASAEVGFR